jgi:selenocysteine-specific elongation factor
VIIGTAGHIDHGKTALVQALTGVDTDRLPEEKRRGITIELGFAPLRLADGRTVGVVDVPGHEAFVRTMLAGATGIDLAMLVIAADEGPMPQTREHLAILSLLGVRGGVVVLTKRDLVEEDWLTLVEDDVRGLLAGTPLADAEIVTASALRREGLDEIRAAIARAIDRIPQRVADDLFRMPADRAFTVRGTGTVVTGTVWSGTLHRDDTIRIMPADRLARVRSLQRHGEAVTEVRPGERAAIGLVGVEVADVPRGSVLVAGAGWQPTTVLRAEVALLETADRPLDPRTRVRFHLGTADVGARVVAGAAGISPASRTAARIVLESPVVARAGDRFVLRTPSPASTIGGGIVEDPLPPHRRGRSAGLPANPAAHLAQLLAEASSLGVEEAALPVRLGITPAASAALVAERESHARRLGGRVYNDDSAATVRRQLLALLDTHHASHPLEPGVSLQSARAKLVGAVELVDAVVAEALAAGDVAVDGGLLRRAGWTPTMTASERTLRDRLIEDITAAGREPPSVGELTAIHGDKVSPLLRLLERAGSVVAVELDRYYATAVIEQLIGTLRNAMVPGQEYGPAELREMLGVSRKYLIPLLEHCDRVRVTDRRPGGRVIVGT